VTLPGAKGSVAAFKSGDVIVWVGDRTGAGPGWASYGDLVAIYGDHKTGIDATSYNTGSELQKFMYNARKSLDALDVDLLHLASTNFDHFSEAAVLKYKEQHLAALREASKAVIEGDMKYMWRALHQEAHAAHMLSDVFASGHLMMDRRPTATAMDQWYEDVLHIQDFSGYLKARGPMLQLGTTQLVDRVVHNCYNDGGVRVKSRRDLKADVSAGRAEDSNEVWWRAYGDGKFFDNDHTNRQHAIDAVQRSLERLFAGYKAMLDKRAAAGPDAAAIKIAVNAEYIRVGKDRRYYDGIDEVPVKIAYAKCVVRIGGAPVIEYEPTPSTWADLPYRKTVEDIHKVGQQP
jgi:hypothetical protein